jgi:type VI secretion system protein
MDVGLLEGLTGYFLSGIEIDEVPEEQRIVQSIIDHLSLLFNERCASEGILGSVLQNQEYGLPDMSEIYIEPSKAKRIEMLRAKIEEALKKFEPRLANIKVEAGDNPPYDYRLTYYLSADISRSNVIQFQTVFSPADPALVEIIKKKR